MRRRSNFSVVAVLVIMAAIGVIGYNYIFAPDKSNEGLSVSDYFPKRQMIAVFNGGYENSGFVNIIDKLTENKIQIKKVNYATGGVSVWELGENEISLVYKVSETEEFDESYLGKKASTNEVLLKGPLRKGTKWTNNENEKCEITGVNVDISTPYGDFKAIEVTCRYSEYYIKRYFARNMGIVKIDDSELVKVDYNLERLSGINNLFDLLDVYLNSGSVQWSVDIAESSSDDLESIEAAALTSEEKYEKAKELNTEGYRLYKVGAYEEALELFRQSFEMYDDYFYPHFNYACTIGVLMKEDYDTWLKYKEESLLHLKRVLEMDPKYMDKINKDPDLELIRSELDNY